MLISCPVSAAVRTSARRLAPLTAVVTVAMLLGGARDSAAQTRADLTSAWEFRATSGGLIPTGAQRNAVKDAQLSAVQLSWLARPSLALTGTFGWARSRDLLTTDDPKLDVFTYDLGAEVRASEWFAGDAVTFTPFFGAGAGGRSDNYRKLDVDATHNAAGYGTAGGELGIGRVGLRLEVRDYVTGFKPLAGRGASETSNDIVVMVGLRFKKGAAPTAP
jgi:hypothetical protein